MPKVKLSLALPTDVVRDLLAKARETGKSISELVTEAVPEVLAR